MLVSSFPWVADKHSKLIILGSIPGVESLRKQQYYAHPRNQFWRIFYALHNQTWSEDYEERILFLLSQKTAVWDVVSHCERKGSLDTKIQFPVMNDFARLFAEIPSVRTLIFNGGKAYDLFMRHIAPTLTSEYTYHKLPSSSPAHTLSFEHKLKEWKTILSV
jgi:hypoxanthine-DNA glycosylase